MRCRMMNGFIVDGMGWEGKGKKNVSGRHLFRLMRKARRGRGQCEAKARQTGESMANCNGNGNVLGWISFSRYYLLRIP